MLNFRNTNIFFTGAFLLSILAYGEYGVPISIFIVLPVAYLSVLFYGCYYIASSFFIRVICSADTRQKVVAISFDDGPCENTIEILRILKDQGVEAAFFCIGNNIKGNEAVLKRIDHEGHIIGNHSYSHHFWFDMFSSKKMLADMQLMDKEAETIIGKKPGLFRPPYGVTNPNLKTAIIKGNYIPVGWSIRTMDTVINDPKLLLTKSVSKIKPGAVFLFHDSGKATIAILPAFIQQVKLNGYKIVRPDKMLNLQPYA